MTLYKKKKPRLEKPDPIDVYVGKRIRKIRLMRGMTQTELAKEIGVEFQQVQKYEVGTNRVSASRLVKIADALDTTIAILFGKYATNHLEDSLFENRRILKIIRVFDRMPIVIQGHIYKLIMEMGKLPLKANRAKTP